MEPATRSLVGLLACSAGSGQGARQVERVLAAAVDLADHAPGLGDDESRGEVVPHPVVGVHVAPGVGHAARDRER